MEGLIFGLIAMAIGAFFSNKKGEENTDPAKQQKKRNRQGEARAAGQKTFKRVEDYAKEIYGDLQTQMKAQPEKVQEIQRRAEQAIDRTPLRETRNEIQKEVKKEIQERQPTGRLSVYQNNRPAMAGDEKKDEDIFPLDANDIRKGIILAEVLMPPKSKR